MSLPYRVETARSVLRCPDPADAERLREVENRSRPQLREFMLWANRDDETVDETIAKLRHFRSQFDTGEDHVYFAFDRATGACLGGSGLHRRIPGGLEIGYWVDTAQHRRGFATEWAAALTRVAFELGGCRWVEIRAARENTGSQGIPTKLGFVHEATLRDRLALPNGQASDAFVFTMLVKDYAESPARRFEVAAFDAVGRKVM